MATEETTRTPGKNSTSTLSGNLQIDEAQDRLLFSVGENTTDRKALFGYSQALNDVGLFITKTGYDVVTEQDLNNYIFNSSQNNLRFVKTLEVSLPSYAISNASGWGNFSVAIPPSAAIEHGAVGVPIIFAYTLSTGGFGLTANQLPITSSQVISSAFVQRTIGYSVNETYIEFADNTVVNGAYSTTATAINVICHVFQADAGADN